MDNDLNEILNRQARQDKEYRIENRVGSGATIGRDMGVAGWRYRNYWRPDEQLHNPILRRKLRENQEYMKQGAQVSEKPTVRRRPKQDSQDTP